MSEPLYEVSITFDDGRPPLVGRGTTEDEAMMDLLLRHDPECEVPS